MVADHRDAMVEAGSGRAGDAPVLWVARALSCGCSLAVRYLEARRSRGPPTERRGLGQASRPADFIRLVPSFGRLGLRDGGENGAGDGQPHLRSDRNRSVGTGDRQPCGRLISEYTGRGPTKRAQAQCRPRHGGRPGPAHQGERSLVRDGRADLVLDLRRAYQARRATIHHRIEEVTGRRANHIDPDIATESVVLAPRQRAPVTPRTNGLTPGSRADLVRGSRPTSRLGQAARAE